ncbi:unnamed protein product, partial [marine sediment metagenome]
VFYNSHGVSVGPTDVVEMNGTLYLLLGEGTHELSRTLMHFDPEGDRWSKGQVLAGGLPYPTALLITPDQREYISIHGAYSSPQTGAVLEFDGLVGRAQSQAPVVYVETGAGS